MRTVTETACPLLALQYSMYADPEPANWGDGLGGALQFVFVMSVVAKVDPNCGKDIAWLPPSLMAKENVITAASL